MIGLLWSDNECVAPSTGSAPQTLTPWQGSKAEAGHRYREELDHAGLEKLIPRS